MNKKIILIILTMIALVMSTAFLVSCTEPTDPAQGELPYTENLEYTLNQDEQSYSVSGALNQTFDDGLLNIPPTYNGLPVTRIASGGFYRDASIKTIIIPDSITDIGASAFEGCEVLDSLTIPFIGQSKDDVANAYIGFIFGQESYTGNSALRVKKIILTGGTEISNYAFYGCVVTEEIILPDSLEQIGRSAFESCSRLKKITIPENVTGIAERAFEGCHKLVEVCNLSKLEIKTGSPEHGYVARYAKNVYTQPTQEDHFLQRMGCLFYNSNGTYYLIEYSGDEKRLSLPKNIEGNSYSIEPYVFAESSLEAVLIPGTVTAIGDYAFYGCEYLEHAVIKEGVQKIGDYAFAECTILKTADIPNSVTSIGTCAFDNCERLESISLSDKLTSLSDGLFYGTGLKSICIPESVETIGNNTFGYCLNITEMFIPDSVVSIGDYAFANCTQLKSVRLPNKLSQVGKSAFVGCRSMTSVIIPEGVTRIEGSAFNNCEKLTEVVLPNSLQSIGEKAFYLSDSIAEVYYCGTAEQWNAIQFDLFNYPLTNATRYYYSETKPTEAGNYWHFVNGAPVKW